MGQQEKPRFETLSEEQLQKAVGAWSLADWNADGVRPERPADVPGSGTDAPSVDI